MKNTFKTYKKFKQAGYVHFVAMFLVVGGLITFLGFNMSGNLGIGTSDPVSSSSPTPSPTPTPTPLPDTTPPAAPANLRNDFVGYDVVYLFWDALTDSSDLAYYSVVRNGVNIARNGWLTSFIDITVSPNTTYNYYIIATDTAGNTSGPSNTVIVTTTNPPDTTPPAAPANLTATAVSDKQIDLSWSLSTDNIGVTSYEVYRANALIAYISNTSFGDYNLTPSTQYDYYVVAVDAANNKSAPSNIATAKTLEPPYGYGVIQGKVSSSAGGGIAGAKVTLKIDKKLSRFVYTTGAHFSAGPEDGLYGFGNLNAGTYTIIYSAERHASQTHTVTVPVGVTVIKNVTLKRK